MKIMLDKYRILKTQRQYMKMIVANIINRFGDSIDQIAFTWLVYELTHSALWSTIIVGLNMLPTILIQPFAGALVERMKKRNVMVVCDCIRGVLVGSIALLYMKGLLKAEMLLMVTLLNSTVEAMRMPAGIAIIPKLLEENSYETGISLNSSLSRAMEFIGTGCAGIIIAMFGIHSAILLDTATFFMSAIIISMISYKEEMKQTQLTIKTYMNTLKDGFKYVFSYETLILACIIGALLNFILMPINGVLPSYINDILKGDSNTLSLLSIGLSIGSIVGSFAYPILFSKVSKRKLMIHTFTTGGIFFVMLIMLPHYLPLTIATLFVFGLFVAIGVMTSAVGTYLSVYLTSQVDSEYLARTGAFFNACITSCIPIASMVMSILLQFTYYINIMIGVGVLCFMIAVILFSIKSVYLLDSNQ